MSEHTPHRARRMVIAVVLLVLLGAGTATAYWTATTQLHARPTAATIGLEHQLLPSAAATPLATTFTADSLAAAGAVTLTNTGSREATYTLTMDAAPGSDTALATALRAEAGEIAAAGDCTVAGSAGQDLPLTSTGTIGAGETLHLCARTRLAAEDLAALAEQQVELALTSTLTYAQSEDWTVRSELGTISQRVGPQEGQPVGEAFTGDGARYALLLDGAFVQRTGFDGITGLALHGTRIDAESEWRLTDAGDGTVHISHASNTSPGSVPAARWTATGAGQSVHLSAPVEGSDAQRWSVEPVAEGQYRFESVAHPGHVLTGGEGLWNPGSTNPRRLRLEPAGDPAVQTLTLRTVGTPYRDVEQMTSGAGTVSEPALSFSPNIGYEAEIEYRVRLARAGSPETLVDYPAGSLSGWHTTVRFSSSLGLREYVLSPDGGYGNTWVHVDQKLPGGDWTPAAVGKIHLIEHSSKNPDALRVEIGWG